jgi:hypothetical protein
MDADRRVKIVSLGLAVALLALVGGTFGAMMSVGEGHGRPEWRFPALLIPLGAAALLLWLRPRPIPYAIGAVALALGLVGWPAAWLALLLPVAWLAFAHSVSHWLVGVMAYAGVGLGHLLLWFVVPVVLGLDPHITMPGAGPVVTIMLFWPMLDLWLMGALAWGPPLLGGQ